jgi:uncharacterized membrane protein (DUF2068 family)
VSKIGKRPKALIAIVAYKSFTATLLGITSIAIFWTFKNFEGLEEFSKSLTLEGKRGIIAWILEKLLNFSPRRLEFTAIAAAVYALVTAIEAVGLWYEKAWARWLVIGVVAVSIPAEVFEITRGISPVKLIIFILNLAILWYLLREFPKPNHTSE